jgi:hypothetical protein
VWEIAFILEEEGFFAHSSTTPPQHINQTESHSVANGSTTNNKCSSKKSQGRRKRSF